MDSTTIPGDVAWRLYDTYGFPIDLTQLMAEERKLTIDMEGYEAAKLRAQEIARGVGGGVDVSINLDVHAISELQKKGLPPTNDLPKYNYQADQQGTYFFESCEGQVVGLRYNKEFVDEIHHGRRAGVLPDKTCFYAEAGGQIYDEAGGQIYDEAGGQIYDEAGGQTYDEGFVVKIGDEDTEFAVKDVQVRGGYVLHVGTVEG